MLNDFSDLQPWRTGIHGLHRTFHRAGFYSLSAPADPAVQTENFSDCRRPSHAPRDAGETLAGQTCRPHRVVFLPGYSPQLNPDELLNQDTKANALSRRRPHNQQELIHETRRHLRRRQRDCALVKRFFLEKHVRYAA